MTQDELTPFDEADAPPIYARGAIVTIGFAVLIVLGYLVFFLRSTSVFG